MLGYNGEAACSENKKNFYGSPFSVILQKRNSNLDTIEFRRYITRYFAASLLMSYLSAMLMLPWLPQSLHNSFSVDIVSQQAVP